VKENDKTFEIVRLGEADTRIAQQLFQLFEDVFGEGDKFAPHEGHLRNLLKNPSFVCFAALHKDEPVGGLTAYSLPMYNSGSAELFIYDIAVKPEFQRKGVGKRLMLAAQAFCTQNGIKQMFVDANEADTHALDFYSSLGGRAEKVVQFTFLAGGEH